MSAPVLVSHRCTRHALEPLQPFPDEPDESKRAETHQRRRPAFGCSRRSALALVLSSCVLIYLALGDIERPAYFQPEWHGEALPPRDGREAPDDRSFPSYLTVCTLVRDEGRYLREWVEFHRLLGVTQFEVYDDGSSDGTEELLRRLGAARGDVRRTAWPPAPADAAAVERAAGFGEAEVAAYRRALDGCRRRDAAAHLQKSCQLAAFAHCVSRHRPLSRWVAVFDVDEFIFPAPAAPGRPLRTFADVLRPEGGVAPDGLAIDGLVFGASGRREPPPDEMLTLEGYQKRAPANHGRDGIFSRFLDPPAKSIFDPRYVERAAVHRHGYVSGARVFRVPAEGGVIRYFHYQYKSAAEARKKAEWNRNPDVLLTPEKDAALSAVADGTAAAFLGPLRERLARPLPPDPGA